MSKARELASLGNAYSDGALSNRNLIINGAMQVAQRGTSFSGPNNYAIDRWKANAIHPVYTVAQQSVTDLAGFSKCMRVQRNVGTTNNAYSIEVNQPVESLNTTSVVGKTVTLSFWARVGSDYAGDVDAFTSTIAYHNLTGSDMGMEEGHFFAEFATTKVVQANTPSTDWTYYTMTADIASDAYQVGVTIATQSWVGTAGANDYFEVTGVQLEVGDTATPFEHRSYGQELALCQRYYWKTTSADGSPFFGGCTAVRTHSGTNDYTASIDFPVEMRVAPTTSHSILNIHKPNVRLEAIASASTSAANGKGMSITVVPTTNDTTALAGFPYGGSIVADAEL